MMWINGGPGCSSSMGLLMELGEWLRSLFILSYRAQNYPGPCSIDMKNASTNGTTWNPYSWNSEANIFFLDQPYVCALQKVAQLGLTYIDRVGVGFSYADYGETVETTEDAAKNVHAFITIFFETFKQFSGRPLHLSGESYGVSLCRDN